MKTQHVLPVTFSMDSLLNVAPVATLPVKIFLKVTSNCKLGIKTSSFKCILLLAALRLAPSACIACTPFRFDFALKRLL
eukprot:scaffold100748_cov14-Tisochrysis_lutea.AAC.1